MENCCSSCQVAQSVCFWGATIPCFTASVIFHDISNSKCLDAIFVTMEHFINAFDEDFDKMMIKHCKKNMSDKDFIDFILPRCMILSEGKSEVNFILTCAFVSRVIFLFDIYFRCFHCTKLASKCLLKVLNLNFRSMFESKTLWEKLVTFCRNINKKAFFLTDWNLGECLGSFTDDDSADIDCSTEYDSHEIYDNNSNEKENGRNSPKLSEYDNNACDLIPKRNCVIGVDEKFTESEDGDEILSCISSDSTGSFGKNSKELFHYDEEYSNYIWRFNNHLSKVLFTDDAALDRTFSLIIKCKSKIDENFLLTNYGDLIDDESITIMEEETPDKNMEAKKSNLVDSSNLCNMCKGKQEKYIQEFSKRYVREYPNLALVSDFIAEEIKKGKFNYY
ncbi:uncharacterized protein TNIN_62151 [Trichonephila inaurata madagascariensis]|uniref:Uncharacterized protein n=1 Tax=Trichonephila inaurata madagascariensis TaxID=2747483 RepID=A0A8X7BP67_9ARAC|nr:uncharacterized protein TNIN_62151 [Trichonephila inaurata madagascariensis]